MTSAAFFKISILLMLMLMRWWLAAAKAAGCCGAEAGRGRATGDGHWDDVEAELDGERESGEGLVRPKRISSSNASPESPRIIELGGAAKGYGRLLLVWVL